MSAADEGLSYGRIMARIKNFSESNLEHVRRIFAWLICTKRPLRAVELKQSIMIRKGDNGFNQQRRLLADVKELCGCIVEEKDDYITFVHYSARE
jgi:hypothetical protein